MPSQGPQQCHPCHPLVLIQLMLWVARTLHKLLWIPMFCMLPRAHHIMWRTGPRLACVTCLLLAPPSLAGDRELSRATALSCSWSKGRSQQIAIRFCCRFALPLFHFGCYLYQIEDIPLHSKNLSWFCGLCVVASCAERWPFWPQRVRACLPSEAPTFAHLQTLKAHEISVILLSCSGAHGTQAALGLAKPSGFLEQHPSW